MRNTSTSGKIAIAAALVLALAANLTAVVSNGYRGQQTCEELEAIKGPEYLLAKENLAALKSYIGDYRNLFGTKPMTDPGTGIVLPRWRIEYNKALKRSSERIDRYAPHKCPFLFWGDV